MDPHDRPHRHGLDLWNRALADGAIEARPASEDPVAVELMFKLAAVATALAQSHRRLTALPAPGCFPAPASISPRAERSVQSAAQPATTGWSTAEGPTCAAPPGDPRPLMFASKNSALMGVNCFHSAGTSSS